MRKIVLYILFMLTLSYSYPQDTIVIKSLFLNYTDTCLVYKPSNYAGQDDLIPLVYLLHGYGGNQNDFGQILDLQNLANKYNMVIACPDGQKDSWYFDSPRDGATKYETFFIKELMQAMRDKYRIDTNNIFITGLSMGGHGAMYIFLRNKTKFKAAGSSSGTLNLSESSQKYLSLSNKLGEFDSSREVFDRFSAIAHLDSIKFGEKKIIVDCGYNDHLFKANQDFNKKAIELKVDITFISKPGWHNDEYWSESFIWQFEFFAGQASKKQGN